MTFKDDGDAITYIMHSSRKLNGVRRGPDELVRDTTPTQKLLLAAKMARTRAMA